MSSSSRKRYRSSTKICKSSAKRSNRLSFSFERVQVNPILRTSLTSRVARSISRKAHKIRFRSKSTRIEITPLPDKPKGRFRMPQESDDDEETDKKNFLLNSTINFDSNSPNQEIKQQKKFLPIFYNKNFDIDIEPSPSGDSIESTNEKNCIVAVDADLFNISKSWSVDESDIYDIAFNLAKNTAKKNSNLWNQAFSPKTKLEIFNNSSRLYSWLEEWINRLYLKKSEPAKIKHKRKSTMYDDDDYDNDEDFKCTDKELSNPLIIKGYCSSGKTSVIYCAAEELKIKVLEFSPTERRNGVLLEKKLAGAIKNHYVHSNSKKENQTDIRQIFSSKSHSFKNNKSNKIFYKLSVVLIDDCDVIFANDDNFWSTLRLMCEESKIPIILTCTNYNYVKKMLNFGTNVYSSESIHFVKPTISRFSRHLRAWLVGYTRNIVSPKWLWKFVEENQCDIRGILNSLQFQLVTQKLDDKQIQPSNSKLSLKSYLKHIKVISELDASYGCKTDDSVTWRAQMVSNLDFNLDQEPAYQPFRKENILMTQSPLLIETLEKFISIHQLSSLFDKKWDINSQEPIKPLRDARLRSWPQYIYSWKNVGTDYMFCLCAIDEKFHSEVRRRINFTNMSADNSLLLNTSSRLRSRSSRYCDRAQHPFDEVDSATVQSIDRNGTLSLSISKYSFPKLVI